MTDYTMHLLAVLIYFHLFTYQDKNYWLQNPTKFNQLLFHVPKLNHSSISETSNTFTSNLLSNPPHAQTNQPTIITNKNITSFLEVIKYEYGIHEKYLVIQASADHEDSAEHQRTVDRICDNYAPLHSEHRCVTSQAGNVICNHHIPDSTTHKPGT